MQCRVEGYTNFSFPFYSIFNESQNQNVFITKIILYLPFLLWKQACLCVSSHWHPNPGSAFSPFVSNKMSYCFTTLVILTTHKLYSSLHCMETEFGSHLEKLGLKYCENGHGTSINNTMIHSPSSVHQNSSFTMSCTVKVHK